MMLMIIIRNRTILTAAIWQV